PDADLEWTADAELVAETARPLADRQAGPHTTQCIVLMDVRKAEDRHHRVADELLRTSAQRRQLLGGRVKEPAEHVACALRVEGLRKAGRVDEIREQDRDRLAFLGLEQRSGGGT